MKPRDWYWLTAFVIVSVYIFLLIMGISHHA